MRNYETPELQEIGSLEQLTEQLYNKIGGTPDTHADANIVVGSLVPYP